MGVSLNGSSKDRSFLSWALGQKPQVKRPAMNTRLFHLEEAAKHGQSPQNRADLTIINDGTMTDALDAAWKKSKNVTAGLVDHAMDDDGVLLWLKDHSQAAADFRRPFCGVTTAPGLGRMQAVIRSPRTLPERAFRLSMQGPPPRVS